MTSPISVADGHVVSIHYTLTLASGEVVDSSADREPLEYLHGHGNIVPGLEEQLTGRGVGDELDAVVPADKGYGEHDPAGVQVVPRDQFPPDVEIESGMQFQAQNEDGSAAILTVSKVEGDEVTVDLNHPLAGETLHFRIQVTAVRTATEEELTHGHVHGPHGHEH